MHAHATARSRDDVAPQPASINVSGLYYNPFCAWAGGTLTIWGLRGGGGQKLLMARAGQGLRLLLLRFLFFRVLLDLTTIFDDDESWVLGHLFSILFHLEHHSHPSDHFAWSGCHRA